MKRNILNTVLAFFTVLFVCNAVSALAQENSLSIATIDLKIIMNESKLGMASQQFMTTKLEELKEALRPEQEQLMQMESDIQKKSSVWSEATRIEKERELMARGQQFQMVSQREMKKLEKNIIEPVLKDINDVTREVAIQKGFTIVLNNSAPGLLAGNELIYAAPSTDISQDVLKALDNRSASEMKEFNQSSKDSQGPAAEKPE
ncbi:MAG: OmpH family outer membrane protein [Proteobacteria bacterium]|nr:OmpH family outer membrane protein [Pseudomonadota bacterium]MBU1711313.1 OmpH family outer membrane protein [Pseudomonadota bacterium]